MSKELSVLKEILGKMDTALFNANKAQSKSNEIEIAHNDFVLNEQEDIADLLYELSELQMGIELSEL